jgi:hypothetical protein
VFEKEKGYYPIMFFVLRNQQGRPLLKNFNIYACTSYKAFKAQKREGEYIRRYIL